MNENDIIKFVIDQILPIKDRLNDAEKGFSAFSEELKQQTEIEISDLEINNIEAQQSISDLEIQIMEMEG